MKSNDGSFDSEASKNVSVNSNDDSFDAVPSKKYPLEEVYDDSDNDEIAVLYFVSIHLSVFIVCVKL